MIGGIGMHMPEPRETTPDAGAPVGTKRMSADEWNARHLVGTRVRYFPVVDERAEYIDTVTRSEAWTLGHGQAVVKVSGRTGGVGLHSLEVRHD